MTFAVRNLTRNTLLASRVERASTFWRRLRGLLGRKTLPWGHGLWIDRCRSIHTHFMRFAIDAVFVSPERKVVRSFERLRPFRFTPLVRGAADCLELPAGTLSRAPVEVGDQLELEGTT